MGLQINESIEGIYVFESTGQLIYNKNFSSSALDPAIISGFFSAVQMFAEGMLSKDSIIQEITLHERKFVFNFIDNGNIIIMAVIRGQEEKETKDILVKIADTLNYIINKKNLTLEGINCFLELYITNLPDLEYNSKKTNIKEIKTINKVSTSDLKP